jgi:hypothetical protein
MLFRRSFELTLIAAFAVILTGCAGGDSKFTEVGHDESEVGHDDHSAHGHGSHGPNGGDIVEVGSSEFHAEVVVDEDEHRIDVFILGPDAKTARPIGASEISISFKHGDEVEEFKLAASALEGEVEGQASKFSITDEELFEELHEHSEGATLSFAAGGESLSGTVTHSHDHGDEHGDSHSDDDDDDEHEEHARGDDEEDHKHGKGHDKDGDEHGENDSDKESKDAAPPTDAGSDDDKEDNDKESDAEGTAEKE